VLRVRGPRKAYNAGHYPFLIIGFCGITHKPTPMPIYRIPLHGCHAQARALQKFSDAQLTVCRSAGRDALDKLVFCGRFHLKGSGWYQTDLRTAAASRERSPKPRRRNQSGETKTGEPKRRTRRRRPSPMRPPPKPETSAAPAGRPAARVVTCAGVVPMKAYLVPGSWSGYRWHHDLRAALLETTLDQTLLLFPEVARRTHRLEPRRARKIAARGIARDVSVAAHAGFARGAVGSDVRSCHLGKEQQRLVERGHQEVQHVNRDAERYPDQEPGNEIALQWGTTPAQVDYGAAAAACGAAEVSALRRAQSDLVAGVASVVLVSPVWSAGLVFAGRGFGFAAGLLPRS